MTVKEIVIEYLKANGYDGLCGEECGCAIDDLVPCDSDPSDCKPGYIHYSDCKCENCKEYDWMDRYLGYIVCGKPVVKE